MPYIEVQTSETVDNEEEFLKKLSAGISEKLGKPESYIMTALQADIQMTFAGSVEKAAFIELKSIGLTEAVTDELSGYICNFLEEELGIKKDRVYIDFADSSGDMWGWDGGTF